MALEVSLGDDLERLFFQDQIGDDLAQPLVLVSSARKRRTSLTSMPPYLAFHL